MYMIFTAVLNKEEVEVKHVGNELVVVWVKQKEWKNFSHWYTRWWELTTHSLTDGQKLKLQQAFAKKTAVTLWVKPEQIGRGEELFSLQINHKKKSASERKGADLNEQDTDLKKRHGDSTFSTLLGLANPLIKPAIEALKL